MANRRKPELSFTGMTLDQWHSHPDLISWAQQDTTFKQICSVMLNESVKVEIPEGCSEGRAFGRVEGYFLFIEKLRSLAAKPTRITITNEADFSERSENALETPEVQD